MSRLIFRRRWLLATAAVLFLGQIVDLASAAAEPQESRRRRRRRRAAPPEKGRAPAPAATANPRAAPSAGPRNAPPTSGFRGPTRIDFDDRLIQGQTNQSGAVYLFDRKETGISSMVRRRKSFRQLTIQTIYDR